MTKPITVKETPDTIRPDPDIARLRAVVDRVESGLDELEPQADALEKRYTAHTSELRTFLAVGDLVNEAAHNRGIVGPVEYELLRERATI